jgi:N utilization substance protein A
MEVPELASGAIEIKALAREPGARTKIAISAVESNVDPVGSLVGQRGVRVSTVMSELGGERIDIIEWSEDPTSFIKEALSPASVIDVELMEEEHRATVNVSADQQSLAIGRGGQNVRLAAKLTGWNIDINSVGGESFHAEGEDATPEGVSDESVSKTEETEDMDPAVAIGLDATESESIVPEDDSEDNSLSAEEETTKSDESNESIVDEEESRDL